MGVREEKEQLRVHYKKLRAGMCPDEKARLDAMIFERLKSSFSYRYSIGILIYVSMPDEIDTHGIISHALKHKKLVAVPRCLNGKNEMKFYRINSLNDVEPGIFNIPEPVKSCEPANLRNYNLCIVPALAFDSHGYRIGYGGGYYDRFLENYSGVTAGLMYSSNIIESVPRGRYDMRVDSIITEKGVTRTGEVKFRY